MMPITNYQRSACRFSIAFLFLIAPAVITAFFSNDAIVNTFVKKIVFMLYSFSFISFMLPFFRPRYFLLMLIPIAAIAAFEIYLLLTFHYSMNDGIMTSFLHTNTSETKEVVSSVNILYVLILLLLITEYVYVAFSTEKDFFLKRRMLILIAVLMMIGQSAVVIRETIIVIRLHNKKATVYSVFSDILRGYTIKAKKTFPANWIVNFLECVEKDKELYSYNERIVNFKFNAIEKDGGNINKNIILVIGESARRNNFSLYGYKRKTNPLLEKEDNIIVMKNAETVFNFTENAYAVFLSRASRENFGIHLSEPSILKAFSEAGFYTIYINNKPLGRSVQYLYAHQADNLIDIVGNAGADSETYSTDGKIIPIFDKIIKENKHKKLFVIIYSKGSHVRYSARYPKEYEIFKPAMSDKVDLSFISRDKKDELVNSYDNSILFTDYFLSKLISILKSESSHASLMMYASDHGENLYDNDEISYMHGGGEMTEYEKNIPLLIWYSKEYGASFHEKVQFIKKNIDSRITTENFFHSTIDMAGIYIDSESCKKSFANSMFNSK